MTTSTLGVIIGRFQTPDLHEGHRHLIDTAVSRSDAVLILIGVSGGFPSARDPLPYRVREAMLREYCPDAVIRPLADHRYRGSSDQVMTALFGAYHLSGAPRAGDDIESVEWVPFRKLAASVVTPHRPLAERVIRFIENGR